MMDDGRTAPQDWAQCHTCKRWFLPKALETHAKICIKITNKKRKVFDSSKQRAEGTDLSMAKPLKPKSESSAADKANPNKKNNNWRKTHEDFIATIRAAKSLAKVMKEGGPLPPPPPPTFNPDYIQCPCCQRRFNETAAERHIKFCQEKSARMPQKSNFEDTKKVQTRTLYKPPPPLKKSNTSVPSNLPCASSNLGQRSGPGQSSVIPSLSFSSAGQFGNNLGSPSSSLDTKVRTTNPGQATVRNAQSRVELNKRRADAQLLQNDVDGMNEVERLKTKFCYKCGSRYPVESAKFCCECGIKRINM